VLSEIRRTLSSHAKIESSTVRVRLTELASSSLNVELLCYVLTRDFNEFAEVREDLLLQIMNMVEDSGASLASPSQTLYLSGDPASKNSTKDKTDAAAKKVTDARDGKLSSADATAGNVSSVQESDDHAQPEAGSGKERRE
jgi:MscS family membrane protein